MEVFTSISDLRLYIKNKRASQLSIGFVATMGALHEGHQSLISTSTHQNDITVCSIFVNPTQFNNQEDIKKYPRNLDQDLQLLKEFNCEFVQGYYYSRPLTIDDFSKRLSEKGILV